MLRQTIAVRIGHLERLAIERAAANLCIGPTTFIRQAALAVARKNERPVRSTVEKEASNADED